MIFSHRYLDSDCINFKTLYTWLFVDPSEHHYSTQIHLSSIIFWNQASTMLNNIFKQLKKLNNILSLNMKSSISKASLHVLCRINRKTTSLMNIMDQINMNHIDGCTFGLSQIWIIWVCFVQPWTYIQLWTWLFSLHYSHLK